MGTPRPLIFFLVTATGLGSAPAGAQTGDVVHVGGSCLPPGTSIGEALRILQAELAPVRVEPLDGGVPVPGRTNVVIAIDACIVDPPGARVTVWTNGVPRVRLVNLADAAPDARDRTLALALAEATRDFAFPAFGTTGSVPASPLEAQPGAPMSAAPVGVVPTGTPIAPPLPALPSLPPSDPRERDLSTADGSRDNRASRIAAPRAGALVRFVAAPSTLLVGAELGVAWRRLGIAISGMGTERNVSLGTASLLAIFASPSLDVLEFTPGTALRVAGELGLVTASGTAVQPATGRSANAAHLGLDLGLATLLPLGDAWALDGFLGAGYASSLTVRAGGREIAGLGGLFVTAGVGMRFPWAP